LWPRRATAIESGRLKIQARQSRQAYQKQQDVIDMHRDAVDVPLGCLDTSFRSKWILPINPTI
jgi:hypothetical protein